jgi:PPM family protein phosphatase
MFRAAETIQRTDTGRQRRGNEDSYYARAPVFVVADGMGGAQAGEVASQIAVETFELGLPPEGTPEERLTVVVQRANGRIHELSHADDARAGMGTTLTAAYLDDDRLVIAHVGDSRAYLFRDGELTRLTQDHSLVDELFRQGKLTEEEALEHPQRSIITRALGPEPQVEVDTWSYGVREGDVVLLCSDGLTSMISDRQVQEILAQAPSLRDAGERLIAGANDAGGRDNITVVLFRVEDVESGGPNAEDQPTMVGMEPVAAPAAAGDGSPSGSRPRATPSPADLPDGSLTVVGQMVVPAPDPVSPAPVPPPVPGSDSGRRARLARTQGPKPQPAGTPPGERHFGRLGKSVAALVAVTAVLFLFGGGGYLASRQLYFLGTNGQGIVTVYRGFPYVLPFGIPMYETYYVSGYPASLIPADRRGALLNHDLHSQSAAEHLINALERGNITG